MKNIQFLLLLMKSLIKKLNQLKHYKIWILTIINILLIALFWKIIILNKTNIINNNIIILEIQNWIEICLQKLGFGWYILSPNIIQMLIITIIIIIINVIIIKLNKILALTILGILARYNYKIYINYINKDILNFYGFEKIKEKEKKNPVEVEPAELSEAKKTIWESIDINTVLKIGGAIIIAGLIIWGGYHWYNSNSNSNDNINLNNNIEELKNEIKQFENVISDKLDKIDIEKKIESINTTNKKIIDVDVDKKIADIDLKLEISYKKIIENLNLDTDKKLEVAKTEILKDIEIMSQNQTNLLKDINKNVTLSHENLLKKINVEITDKVNETQKTLLEHVDNKNTNDMQELTNEFIEEVGGELATTQEILRQNLYKDLIKAQKDIEYINTKQLLPVLKEIKTEIKEVSTILSTLQEIKESIKIIKNFIQNI